MTATATGSGARSAAPRVGRTLRESAFLVLCGLSVSLALKSLLFQLFVVPSESMDPTLRVGDKIVAGRLWPQPLRLGRGDVIVFSDPSDWLPAGSVPAPSTLAAALEFVGLVPRNSGTHLVKRVVGIGGDRVECTPAGTVRLNGSELVEDYLTPAAGGCGPTFTVEVPEHCLWVMGDNRANSADSRYHRTDRFQGCVPESSVVGRVVAVAWPPGSIGLP